MARKSSLGIRRPDKVSGGFIVAESNEMTDLSRPQPQRVEVPMTVGAFFVWTFILIMSAMGFSMFAVCGFEVIGMTKTIIVVALAIACLISTSIAAAKLQDAYEKTQN